MSDLQIRGDVYADDIKRSLNELAKATNKTAAQIIQDRAPMMARYLAEWTMPVAGIKTGQPDGGGIDAKRLGESAVLRDINRVYLDARKIINSLKQMHAGKTGESMARAFTKAAKAGDVPQAQQILRRTSKFAGLEVMLFDDGKKHEAAKRNGRVTKGNKPDVVLNPKELQAYITKKRKLVGWTKAAWINAGKQVSGKTGRVGKWITRHTDAPANGQFIKTLTSAESKLTSGVPWVSQKIDDRRAMEAFDQSMRQSLTKALDYIAQKQQRKQ
jgi:hypothetical protein